MCAGDEALEGRPSTLLTMAGIFEKTWCEDEEVCSFTVITVDASDDFSWLHHRMPALLGLKMLLCRLKYGNKLL